MWGRHILTQGPPTASGILPDPLGRDSNNHLADLTCGKGQAINANIHEALTMCQALSTRHEDPRSWPPLRFPPLGMRGQRLRTSTYSPEDPQPVSDRVKILTTKPQGLVSSAPCGADIMVHFTKMEMSSEGLSDLPRATGLSGSRTSI